MSSKISSQGAQTFVTATAPLAEVSCLAAPEPAVVAIHTIIRYM